MKKPSECGHTIQQSETRRETLGDREGKGRQDLWKADAKGNKKKTRGDKASGRRTHHPTKGNPEGDKGDKETRPWEGGHTIQQRKQELVQWEIGRQDPRKGGHTIQQGKQEGAQWETKEDKTLGKADHHPTKENKKGYNCRQRETRPPERQTIQQRKTRRGTMGDKGRQDPRKGGHTIEKQEEYNGRQRETRPSERRTHHPTKGNKKGYNGRQRKTRPSERRTTIQQRKT